MIQLEFETIRGMFRATVERLRRRPVVASPSAIDYTLRLSAALRVVNLTHQLHDVLCAVAKLESRHGFATVPRIALELGCTFMNVQLHVMRNRELFDEDESEKPKRLRLSAEALRLMGKIKTRIAKSHE